MMILVSLILIPFVYWAIIQMNFYRLGTPEAVKKFGTLYLGVDISKIGKTTYTIVFLVRRFLFAVASSFIAKRNNSLGIILVAYLNIAIQMYIVHVFPLESKSNNIVELFSEVLLHYIFLSFVLIQLQFTAISANNMGWGSVAIVVALIALNLSNMLYDIVANLIRSLRKRYHDRINKQRLAAFDAGRKEQLEMLERFESELNQNLKMQVEEQ